MSISEESLYAILTLSICASLKRLVDNPIPQPFDVEGTIPSVTVTIPVNIEVWSTVNLVLIVVWLFAEPKVNWPDAVSIVLLSV